MVERIENGGQPSNNDNESNSSGPPSEYTTDQSSVGDVDEAEFGEDGFYIGSLPMSDDAALEAIRVKFG